MTIEHFRTIPNSKIKDNPSAVLDLLRAELNKALYAIQGEIFGEHEDKEEELRDKEITISLTVEVREKR